MRSIEIEDNNKDVYNNDDGANEDNNIHFLIRIILLKQIIPLIIISDGKFIIHITWIFCFLYEGRGPIFDTELCRKGEHTDEEHFYSDVDQLQRCEINKVFDKENKTNIAHVYEHKVDKKRKL